MFLKSRNVRVLTVGQPCVGDNKMAQSVDTRKNLALYRMVCEDGTYLH
jgi:hypothetical protein